MLNFKSFSKKQLWILLILVPAVIFLIRYIVFDIKNKNETTFYTIKISDLRENIFEINSETHPQDVSVIMGVLEESSPAGEIDLGNARSLTLEIIENSGKSNTVELFIIMPNNENDDVVCAYFKDDVLYASKNKYSSALASSSYALSLYPLSLPPTLTTYSLDTVLPTQILWNYKAIDGSFKKNAIADIAQQKNVYFQNGKMDFSFSIKPSTATISISDGTSEIYFGSLETLSNQNINVSGTLYINIKADWKNDPTLDYFGNAEYDFIMEYMAPAQFDVNTDATVAGGFIILHGTNISDHTKINLSTDPKLITTPRFVANGTSASAILPISFDAQYKSITLTVQYGEIVKSITVNIEPIQATTSPLQINLSQELVDKFHTQNSSSEFRGILNEVCKSTWTENILFSEFESPEEWKSTELILSASEIYKVNDLYSNTSIENHYSMPYGSPVRSLNGGAIVKLGFCDNLGNFVVVDHGAGVKTWYSHLSEITVKENDFVNKNDIIGRAGNSGYAFTCGTSIFCTIGYIPVSINEIIKNGIRFFE